MAAESGRFGLSVALATPFASDGSVDSPLLTSHAARCLRHGCNSVTLFGTTGEGPSLSRRERHAIYALVQSIGIAGNKLIAAVVANSAGDAAEQVADAYDAGAKGILLAPPSYFKGVTEDGVFDWYQTVIGQFGENARDIYLYNIPSLTGVPISVRLVSRIRKAFGDAVAGIKDSGCDWSATEPLVHAHRDISVLVGDERDLAAAVRIGGAGSISGMANVFPETVAGLTRGRDDPFIDGVVDVIDRLGVIPAIKAMIAEKEAIAGWRAVRPPLLPLDTAARKHLTEEIKALKQTRAA